MLFPRLGVFPKYDEFVEHQDSDPLSIKISPGISPKFSILSY